ncbi:hypothetical protein D9A33_09125 [Vibrio cholerae]|nr:hypothetical protein [Vibrio cholerae]
MVMKWIFAYLHGFYFWLSFYCLVLFLFLQPLLYLSLNSNVSDYIIPLPTKDWTVIQLQKKVVYLFQQPLFLLVLVQHLILFMNMTLVLHIAAIPLLVLEKMAPQQFS